MKISIITVSYNSKDTLEETIRSVLAQDCKDIEYIIIDGGSSDGTVDIIRRYEKNIFYWVSEKDKGVYEAMNKGLKRATGDVIGFLNSDDLYASADVIRTVKEVFLSLNVDSCYGDLVYVERENPEKIIRYWKSSPYRIGSFKLGWMLPHPTFFVRRNIYEKYGGFLPFFKISGDYEIMLRFLEKYRISSYYIPKVLVKMRWGGKSNRNVKYLVIKMLEDYKAWKVNRLPMGIYTILFKNFRKIPQFLNKR
jgi:glycosyltransferase